MERLFKPKLVLSVERRVMLASAMAILLAGLLTATTAMPSGAAPSATQPITTNTPAPSLAGPSPSTSVQTCKTDLQSGLQTLNVPGLSAGIVKNGRLVCTAVAGMASIEQNRPVTPDTLFLWASVSKTVTATAVMTLYDQGKFKLDDDINKYLPFQVHIPSCPTNPITFRELLTHTSSIKDNDNLINSHALQVQGDSPIALADLVKGYLTPGGQYYSKRANFHSSCPGTVYDYSNMGATTLGYLVQVLSGTPFNQYVKDHIFAPLGMTNSSFKLAGLDPSHIAMPYGRSRHRYSGNAATGFKPDGQYGEADCPDGMMRTSVPQLAHFLIMYAQNGQYQGQQILAQSTVQQMFSPQTTLDKDDIAQGLIWYEDNFGSNVWGHNGEDDGAASNMFFDPATGAGVILVANGDWNNGSNDKSNPLMNQLFQEASRY